jgi:hypothetical protein
VIGTFVEVHKFPCVNDGHPVWAASQSGIQASTAHRRFMIHLIGVGHSHLHSVVNAWKEFASSPTSGICLSAFQMLDARYQPFREVVDGQLIVNANLVADVRQVADSPDAKFFLYAGGSEHVRWGLINDPRPFDFVTPSTIMDDEALHGEVFPYEMLVALGRQAGEQLTAPLAFVRSLTDQPIYQLCLPPPVSGADLGRVKLGAMFEEGSRKYGIAPDPFRVRVWQICVEGLRRACHEKGVLFLEAPQEMIGADGCLVPGAVGHDAVHANALYGRLLLDQLINA